MKLFMLGAVCRVFHPGIKFETVRTVFERSVRNITSVTKDVIALYETSDVMEIGTALWYKNTMRRFFFYYERRPQIE